ncbi:hypothetical protein BJ166DRAFT_506490 [Pestalotiopsis sp. NC0098]|nr:hypothetical protein BJ166DRAFT_506490 [Pestalotiopsis sp. NC0098]
MILFRLGFCTWIGHFVTYLLSQFCGERFYFYTDVEAVASSRFSLLFISSLLTNDHKPQMINNMSKAWLKTHQIASVFRCL